MDIGEQVTAESRAQWRTWLASHHMTRSNIWLVLYKKGSRQASVKYDEAVEEALCFGWIDGQMKSIDSERYALRFSPRRKRSN